MILMFGLFKKKLSAEDYGLKIFKFASGFVSSDALRSLGTTFPNFDGSHGWTAFLEERGLNIEEQGAYISTYFHAALQTTCFALEEPFRYRLLKGATSPFTHSVLDFDLNYQALDCVHHGEFRFDANSELFLHHEIPPQVRDTARYLALIINDALGSVRIDSENFKLFSGTFFTSITSVGRAVSHVSRIYKLKDV
jgi:hypothetical protein